MSLHLLRPVDSGDGNSANMLPKPETAPSDAAEHKDSVEPADKGSWAFKM